MDMDVYIVIIHECQVLELRIAMNVDDHRSFLRCLSSSEKDLKN